jgi:purine-cytosine permease-like protein
MVFCVLLGSSGPEFDFKTVSIGSAEEVNAKRLAFFSLCLAAAMSWVPGAADYHVYYSPDTGTWRIWFMTTVGVGLAMTTTLLLGVGLGTGIAHNPRWGAIYDGTPGSVVIAGYDRLGALGKFCAFLNVLTIVSNNAPGSYSMAMNFQMLGNFWCKVPRPVFTTVSTAIYTACAIGGRDSLYQIFKNLVPLIGYWIVIWFTIFVESDLMFNRDRQYDWSVWNNPQKLPVGFAATVAFLIGWGGAIVGMVCTPRFSKKPSLLTVTRTKFTTLDRLQKPLLGGAIWEFGWVVGSRRLRFPR